MDFPGVGELEVIPNGDAVLFADMLGIGATVRETTRCTFRWPGHSAIWYPLAKLGFLDDRPVPGVPGDLSPRDFLVRHLGPRLQYSSQDRDLVVMRVIASGLRGGRRVRLVYDLLDQRDLSTGFLAMTRTVGFSVSIAAQMVAAGEIGRRGVLSAVHDIPPAAFLGRLRERGIRIEEREEILA
jgi:saccharopine dehydrogenase-like NADP-dependent oxidoreductase